MKYVAAPVRPGITAKLVGGLGNQLFILAAGLEQARRVDCPLYLDISAYGRENERSFELSKLSLPRVFVLDPKFERYRRLSQKIFSFIKSRQHYIESEHKKYDDIFSIKPNTIISGFFQEIGFSPATRNEILIALNNYSSLVDLKSNQLAIHLRKGDYLLKRNQDSYGVISARYVVNGISFVSETNKIEQITIYCDTPGLAETLANEIGAELIGPADLDDPMRLLLSIANSESLIMTNSSLSWWAGCLLGFNSPEAIVIAPSPWFRDGSVEMEKLLVPGWQPIEASFE